MTLLSPAANAPLSLGSFLIVPEPPVHITVKRHLDAVSSS